MKQSYVFLILWTAILLTSCRFQGSPPTPTVVPVTLTVTSTMTPIPPTETATSTPTLTPTLTATPPTEPIVGFDGCVITTPPPEARLDSFYTKYCSAYKIPIVASNEVPDLALKQAWNIIVNMLAMRPDVAHALAVQHVHFGVIGAGQVTTDMPEYRNLNTQFPGVDWNVRARGLGATDFIPLASGAEENLLCYRNDRYRGENITVHEFGHTILDMGVHWVTPSLESNVKKAYQNAISAGLWKDTYAATDYKEYWAEGVQDYFNTNLQASPPDGIHNKINTREELKEYDSALYDLMIKVFPLYEWTPMCPKQ